MAYEIEQYLNVRSASAPSYSPDGQRIAFVSNLTGIPLPWVVPASGGWPHPLSLATEGTGQVVFSPSGQHVAFDRDHGGDEHWQLLVCNPEGGDVRPFTFDPDVSHRFGQWSPDGDSFSFASNAIERRRFDVYIQALDGDAPRLVYSGEESAEPVSWTPDGTRLIVQQGARSESTDLYMVDAAGGDAVHLTPHGGEAAYHPAGFSANGRTLYLRTDQSQEFLGLARLDLRDGNLEFDLVSDWDVESAALSPNKRRTVYSKNVDGASEITLRDLRSAEEYPIPGLPLGAVSGLTWAPHGRSFAFALNSSQATSDIWSYNLRQRRLQQVTQSPRVGMGEDALVESQVVRFPALDGLEISGILYAPRNAKPDNSHAAIVQVHGGPSAQTRQVFEPVLQYFANRGYVVLATNVRGSTGYGRTYNHLDDVRKRMDSVADLEAANSWLRSSGWAHPERIAVMGPSYGGFMVLSAVTTYPDSWAAAVNERGVADFIMHLERTEPQGRKLREIEYGTIEEDGDFLRSISPINHVEKIRVPMVVVHGANDPRVNISVAEALVAELREYNVPVEYLRFEDEGHGMVRLANKLRAYPAVADFLDQHLQGANG